MRVAKAIATSKLINCSWLTATSVDTMRYKMTRHQILHVLTYDCLTNFPWNKFCKAAFQMQTESCSAHHVKIQI